MIIIIAILIFSLIIIFHELGHFLLAKANHITVTEFAVGMGPILLKTTRGETTYALKLLPFGGSCAMLGEDEEESGEGSFNSKSVWARMAVIAAGPVFNLILAFFLSIIVISYSGSGPARVVEVAEGSPEAEAGLEAGDVITSYNGRHISLGKELSTTVSMHGIPTDEIRLTVERDGEDREIVYVPS
ncbi:MAG: site-2 protease family protein, partial [Lachnospiraceae bacterium]|nr:site-2 protease family protein [Lachnospiraceae bacterium]